MLRGSSLPHGSGRRSARGQGPRRGPEPAAL